MIIYDVHIPLPFLSIASLLSSKCSYCSFYGLEQNKNNIEVALVTKLSLDKRPLKKILYKKYSCIEMKRHETQ